MSTVTDFSMTGTANAMTRDHLGLCRWESCGQSTLNLTDLVTGKQVASFKAGGSMTMPWETEKDNITVMCNCQDSIWMRLVVASGIIEADILLEDRFAPMFGANIKL